MKEPNNGNKYLAKYLFKNLSLSHREKQVPKQPYSPKSMFFSLLSSLPQAWIFMGEFSGLKHLIVTYNQSNSTTVFRVNLWMFHITVFRVNLWVSNITFKCTCCFIEDNPKNIKSCWSNHKQCKWPHRLISTLQISCNTGHDDQQLLMTVWQVFSPCSLILVKLSSREKLNFIFF